VAPKYFTRGEHVLTFTISGVLMDDVGPVIRVPRPFTETRQITLIVREVDKAMAREAIDKSRAKIELMRQNGWVVSDLLELNRQATELLQLKKYEEAAEVTKKIEAHYSMALEVAGRIDQLTVSIAGMAADGIDTPKTTRLIDLASLAFSRGEYDKALQRIGDAESVFALETKGAFNVTAFVVRNSGAISIVGILILVLAWVSWLAGRFFWLRRRSKSLKSEENLLLGLIRSTQDACFVQKRISMSEYYETLSHYERKISQVVERSISVDTQRINLLKVKSKEAKLREERDHLLGELKKTQGEYFNKGLLDSRIYEAKTKSLMSRYSKVEKDIVMEDTKKYSRTYTGWLSLFWKVYYAIFA